MAMYGRDTSLLESNEVGSMFDVGVLYEELPAVRDRTFSGEFVKCKMCNSLLDTSDQSDLYVITCHSCRESTPVKNAPFGKKYYRCSCKCLLICNDYSLRITCPRCEKISKLSFTAAVKKIPPRDIRCAYCNNVFVNDIDSDLVKCTVCSKESALKKLGVTGAIVFLTVMALPVAFIHVMNSFFADDNLSIDIPSKFYVIYALFVIGVFLLICIRSYFLKISTVLGPTSRLQFV